MKIKSYKIKALFLKDLKSTFANKNIFLLIFLPIVFSIIYTFLFKDVDLMGGMVISLCSLMNLVIVPICLLSMMISEEKEKNTLRTLMMSGVNGYEFLLSKSIVILLITMITSTLIFFITGVQIALLGGYLFLIFLTSLSLIFFGAIFGILCKNQMATGSMSAPMMLALLMPAVFSELNSGLKYVARLFPTMSFSELLTKLINGSSIFSFTTETVISYGVFLIWIVLGIVLFVLIYRKKGLDN